MWSKDEVGDQTLSSLVVASLAVEEPFESAMGPKVQTHWRLRFLLPATGVSGGVSLSSSSEDDESRLSPVRGDFDDFDRGEFSVEEIVE